MQSTLPVPCRRSIFPVQYTQSVLAGHFCKVLRMKFFCLQLCVRKIHPSYVQKSYSGPPSLSFSHADLLTVSHTMSRCSHHSQGKTFTFACFSPAYSTLLIRSLPESLSQYLALWTLALLLSRALILVFSAVVIDKTLRTNTTWREKRLCGIHTGHSSLLKEGKAGIKAGTWRQEPWGVQLVSLLSGSLFHRLPA